MPYLRRLAVIAFILSSLLITIVPAHGMNATVTDCANFTGAGTISDAMTTAIAGGGTITFACGGTIAFTSQFTIPSGTPLITINANGYNVIFDGGSATRFFTLDGGSSLTLNDLTLQNGFANSASGGAIVVNTATLTVNRTTFSGNSSGLGGGAISIAFNSLAIITDSTFTNNTAPTASGGAINGSWGNIIIINSRFTGNSALLGGAMDIFTNTIASITDSFISGNTATAADAIFSVSVTPMTSQNTHYGNNDCIATLPITDNGGNTNSNSPSCPGSVPITLNVSALACNGDNAEFTINAGDANFDVAGTGVDLPLSDVGTGTITLTGAGTWTDIIVTERRGERDFINIGGITCPEGVIIPPSVPSVPTVTVLGCALDTADGVEIAGAPDNTYCRILMKNGGVISYSGAIPADLIGLGVILAVDVYRLEGGMSINTFPDYARICLSGVGRYFYMDGRNAPRVSVEMPTESVDGLTCAWIPAPGTVILTN